MTTQDIVAIVTLLISVLTVIFILGQQSQKLNQASKDLDHLFNKVRDRDEQMSLLEKAFIRTEQRVTFLEDRIYGDETIARVRQ